MSNGDLWRESTHLVGQWQQTDGSNLKLILGWARGRFEKKSIFSYTGEPISLYMIGKDARHNQVLISQNDHL